MSALEGVEAYRNERLRHEHLRSDGAAVYNPQAGAAVRYYLHVPSSPGAVAGLLEIRSESRQ